jgi:hypothetical protein
MGLLVFPAFPYCAYTKLLDDDIRALYAFLMIPHRGRTTMLPNTIPFPLRIPRSRSSFSPGTEAPVGLGEPATTVVAPAIGNAIFAASGARVPSSANPAGSHAASDRGPDVTKQRPFLVHLTRDGITGSNLAGSSTPLRANFRITEVFSFCRKTWAPKYQTLIVLTDAFCAKPLRRSAATLLARYRLRRVQEYRLGRRSRSPHRGD